MKHASIAVALFASALLAACNTGNGASGTVLNPISLPTPSGNVAPSSVLQTATINGGPAFVSAGGNAVYTWDNDLVPNQSACTGGCFSVWPPVPAATGTLPAPWSVFLRGDNGLAQLAYKGKPLYTFRGDSAPGVANGEGINHFHVARP